LFAFFYNYRKVLLEYKIKLLRIPLSKRFMVTIRLARGGAKKRPYFHITVADSRRARDGKYIERVGFFNPIASAQNDRLNIDHERLDYWVSKGAQVTERVKTLIKESKLSTEDFNQLIAKKEKLRLVKLEKKKSSAS
jgi:small subunit ribosomal protein S16